MRTLLFSGLLVGVLAAGGASLNSANVAGGPPAERILSVVVEGTALRITLSSGRELGGEALRGAILSVQLPDRAGISRLRLNTIQAAPDDSDLLLYSISVLDPETGTAEPLCEADDKGEGWAFPLRGKWNDKGERVAESGFTLACATGGAIGKCVRWGYKPWKKLADGTDLAVYHQACVRMVRADYCGEGQGTTRDSMPIDVYDQVGILRPDDAGAAAASLAFEAAWNENGALCVARTRVPENIALDQLGSTCPRLRLYLGPANCLEVAAEEGQYGPAVLFSRTQ